MAAGDFECLEGASEGVPIRVCATPGKRELGGWRSAAGEILTAYNRYYDIKYPFGSSTWSRSGFRGGAMENTAAIFYEKAISGGCNHCVAHDGRTSPR